MNASDTAAASCQACTDKAELESLHGRLAEVAETPQAASSIVQHPDWLRFELEIRGNEVSPVLMVARNPHGRILGYAPFLCERRRARLALRRHGITLYHGPMLRLLGDRVVAAPRDRRAAEDAVATALVQDRSDRVIHIPESKLPSPLATALGRVSNEFTLWHENLLDQVNWTIQPLDSLASYLDQLGPRRKKLKYALRNVYKKLGDQAQLRIFDASEDMAGYCRLMNQLYAKTWHSKVKPMDWQHPARRALFERLARRQQIIGHVLMLDTQPVAYVHGYRIGNRYLLDDTGYDEEFAALGVGSALIFQTIQDLLERDPGQTIDFGYGDNQYKRVLGNQQDACGVVYLVRGLDAHLRFSAMGLLGTAARCAYIIRDRIRNARTGKKS